MIPKILLTAAALCTFALAAQDASAHEGHGRTDRGRIEQTGTDRHRALHERFMRERQQMLRTMSPRDPRYRAWLAQARRVHQQWHTRDGVVARRVQDDFEFDPGHCPDHDHARGRRRR